VLRFTGLKPFLLKGRLAPRYKCRNVQNVDGATSLRELVAPSRLKPACRQKDQSSMRTNGLSPADFRTTGLQAMTNADTRPHFGASFRVDLSGSPPQNRGIFRHGQRVKPSSSDRPSKFFPDCQWF